MNPGYGDARYNLGVVLLDQQRAGEALAAFESVIAERANDAELFNNRGVALPNLKRASPKRWPVPNGPWRSSRNSWKPGALAAWLIGATWRDTKRRWPSFDTGDLACAAQRGGLEQPRQPAADMRQFDAAIESWQQGHRTDVPTMPRR